MKPYIEKALFNIEVSKRDIDCLRFLRPEDPYDIETVYELFCFFRLASCSPSRW